MPVEVVINPSYLAALSGDGGAFATRVQGVLGLGEYFCDVADGLSRAIHRQFGAGAERLRFPPVMARADLERIGYFRNFPQLLGTVHCFCGDERTHRDLVKAHDAGEDWSAAQLASDLVLTPAACYPVYPALAARGVVPPQGYTVQVQSYCFRREPSDDPARLQSFQMHEFVRVGSPEQAQSFRADWMVLGKALFDALHLPSAMVTANDPFFGRAGGVMGQGQRAHELKYELTAVVADTARPNACMSFNYHLDHFSAALGLRDAAGEPAHTACVGFGVERIVFALFHQYGPTLAAWPADVRQLLEL
jgi:seryl-tRNA synthetase